MSLYGGKEFSVVKENAGIWGKTSGGRLVMFGEKQKRERRRSEVRPERAAKESNRVLRKSNTLGK